MLQKILKIDIISGFLGAGKTTLINRLIREAYKGEKVVLIENEFGEVSVDSEFLSDSKIDIKELSQGCICCSLQGDFTKSLKEVLDNNNYITESDIFATCKNMRKSKIFDFVYCANTKRIPNVKNVYFRVLENQDYTFYNNEYELYS